MKLFETIKWVEGKPQHLDYHEARANASRIQLFGTKTPIKLIEYLSDLPPSGAYRVRIVYSEIVDRVEVEPLRPSPIRTLKRVKSTLDYSHKLLDRSKLDELFAKRGQADDVLIVKEGWITDTTIANVAFFDGQKWLTPEKPLLPGIFRAFLLNKGVLTPARIHLQELSRFRYAAILNALRGMQVLPTGSWMID
ncbi:MAG: aminotransferase class IV [Candidatus Margulisiibacteriota bacterium]